MAPHASAGWARLLAALLLVSPLAGCLDAGEGGQPAPDGPGPEDPPETRATCDNVVLPGERDGQRGKLLHLACKGVGPGTQRGTVACPHPQQAELEAGANLTAGQVQLAVHDAQGDELVNRTLQDTGGEPREVAMAKQQAAPGTWELWVQRGQGFQGSYRVELWCPQG